MKPDVDAIVVGSGCSGVHAAWALVHAHAEGPDAPGGPRALRVLMLDTGARDTHYRGLIPPRPWLALRQAEPDQHRYFLGDRFEGVPLGEVRVGAQLTPPRAHVARALAEHAPAEVAAFAGMTSLAEGGLGGAWGAGVARFNDLDLHGTGLRASDLAPHYRAVERRIGVCGEQDDLTPHLGAHEGLMPALALDSGARAILRRYRRRRAGVNSDGLVLGITRLAACSTGFGAPGGHTRGPHRLDDLDFFADSTRAVYRPAWTLAELRERQNFTYLGGMLVQRFHEVGPLDGAPPHVEVHALDLGTGEVRRFTARRLVVAAGVLGTARLVLSSLGSAGQALPLVCNPYTYAPALNLNVIGETWSDRRHSLSQLTGVFHPPRPTPGGEVWRDGGREREPEPLHVSVYSYRSLLTFKLMQEMPLPMPSARRVARVLQAVVSVLGVHHAGTPSAARRLVLERAAGERDAGSLRIDFALSDAESLAIERREQALAQALRRLRLIVLARRRPGLGASIHYAGPLPLRPLGAATPWTCDPRGVLHGTRAVHIADGCLLPALPAKGLTLTLMALADRVGGHAARALHEEEIP